MIFGRANAAIFAALSLFVSGCATSDPMDLGEGKNEFEQYSQGGNYRFQYVAEGSDGYRAILWRQGESLSDDRKDEKLVSGVVRAVFLDKFCKELKQPVALADGSPSPVGGEGKWVASLRCAAPPPPPPKPKPEKKIVKPKPKPKPDAVAEAQPEKAAEPPTSSSSSDGEPKPKAKKSNDGPMVCEARNGGFDCRPK